MSGTSVVVQRADALETLISSEQFSRLQNLYNRFPSQQATNLGEITFFNGVQGGLVIGVTKAAQDKPGFDVFRIAVTPNGSGASVSCFAGTRLVPERMEQDFSAPSQNPPSIAGILAQFEGKRG